MIRERVTAVKSRLSPYPSPAYQLRIASLELAMPLALSLHGIVMLSFQGSGPLQWGAVLATALLGITGWARQVGTPLLRAIALLVITGMLLSTTGGSASFFLLWFFVIVAIYPLMLETPFSLALPFAVGFAYLLIDTLVPSPIPTIVVLARVFLLLFIGLIIHQLKLAIADYDHERDQTMAALRLSEEKFATAFWASPNAVLISEVKTGRYLEVNDVFCRITGYSREELVGHTSLELGLWAEPPKRDQLMEVMARDGRVNEWEAVIRKKDGSLGTLVISAQQIELEKVPGLLTVAQEVTRQRAAQARIAHQAALLQNVSDAIISTNMNFDILSWNNAAEAIYGWTAEEAIGQPMGKLVPTLTSGSAADATAELMASGQWTGPAEQTRKDGSRVYVLSSVSLIRDDGQEPTGAVAVNRDNTARKMAEEAQRQYAKQLEIMLGINTASLSAQSTDNILEATLTRVPELIACQRVSITLLDYVNSDGRTTAVNFDGDGHPRFTNEVFSLSDLQVDAWPAAGARLENDTTQIWPRWPALDAVHKSGIRAFILCPLRAQQELLGTFNIGADHENAFTSEHVAVAQAIANQLTIAIQNARLHKSMEAHVRSLESLHQAGPAYAQLRDPAAVGEQVLQTIARVMEYKRGALAVFDKSGQRLQLLAHDRMGLDEAAFAAEWDRVSAFLKTDQSVLHWVATHGRSYRSGDVTTEAVYLEADSRTQSELCVPLLVSGRSIGALNVEDFRPRAFGENDERLLQIVASQAAVAIENARLFAAEQQARKTAEILREATFFLSQTLDVDTILATLLERLARLIPFTSANVMLRQSATRVAVSATRSYEHWTDAQETGRITFDITRNRAIGEIFANHASLLIADTREYEGWERPIGAEHVINWMGVPLIAGGEVIGLYSIDHDKPGVFTRQDVQMAEALAAQAAVAIQNARLLEDVRAARDELSALTDYLQTTREDERRRISREIHDEFGQLLTAIKMDLAWLSRQLSAGDDRLRDKVKETVGLVDQSIHTIRRIATELRPGLLDDLGLTAALQWQAGEFTERSGIACELALDEVEANLDKELVTAVFRIFQETLTNVVRHAQASQVRVQLTCRPEELKLMVEDNGRGFDPATLETTQSLGIIGMRERARAFQGSLQIIPKTNQGTAIVLAVPNPFSQS